MSGNHFLGLFVTGKIDGIYGIYNRYNMYIYMIYGYIYICNDIYDYSIHIWIIWDNNDIWIYIYTWEYHGNISEI